MPNDWIIRHFWIVYLCLDVALCCLRVVIHLIGDQRHEERETADVAGAGLSAVERLRGKRKREKSIKMLLC